MPPDFFGALTPISVIALKYLVHAVLRPVIAMVFATGASQPLPAQAIAAALPAAVPPRRTPAPRNPTAPRMAIHGAPAPTFAIPIPARRAIRAQGAVATITVLAILMNHLVPVRLIAAERAQVAPPSHLLVPINPTAPRIAILGAPAPICAIPIPARLVTKV